jgi:hypothetical protein
MHPPAPWASTCRLDEPCAGHRAGDDEQDGCASDGTMSPRAMCPLGDAATAVGHVPEGTRAAALRAGSRWTMITDPWPVGPPATSGGVAAAGPGPGRAAASAACGSPVPGCWRFPCSTLRSVLSDGAVQLAGDCIGSGGTGLTLRTEVVPPSTVRAALGPSGVGPLEPGCGPVPPADAARRPHPAAVALALAAVRRATRQAQPILSRPTETAHPLRDTALKYPTGVYG